MTDDTLLTKDEFTAKYAPKDVLPIESEIKGGGCHNCMYVPIPNGCPRVSVVDARTDAGFMRESIDNTSRDMTLLCVAYEIFYYVPNIVFLPDTPENRVLWAAARMRVDVCTEE